MQESCLSSSPGKVQIVRCVMLDVDVVLHCRSTRDRPRAPNAARSDGGVVSPFSGARYLTFLCTVTGWFVLWTRGLGGETRGRGCSFVESLDPLLTSFQFDSGKLLCMLRIPERRLNETEKKREAKHNERVIRGNTVLSSCFSRLGIVGWPFGTRRKGAAPLREEFVFSLSK